MTGTHAVREGRPSTRRTRGTAGLTERKPEIARKPGERRVRSSTRGTTQDQPAADRPVRTASTRNRQVGQTTRVRASTRQSVSPAHNTSPNRTQVQGARREVKRNQAPLQFVAVMFFVVIVSVFAFGLLQGNPASNEVVRPDGESGFEVIYEKNGTTSTNTGILRGK
ncbi:hypothetical protein [Metabacillus sp. SLBN-84]